MWAKFQVWLYRSPLASALKVALGAALGAAADQLATSNVSPIWVAVGAAAVPIIVNYLNPDDPRYGSRRTGGE